MASERASGGAIWANPGLELRKTDRTSWPRFSDAAAPAALQLNSNLELTNEWLEGVSGKDKRRVEPVCGAPRLGQWMETATAARDDSGKATQGA
ncbi:hypothetical protein TsFJ059_007138 [Trichoderma semiorbis]|uniref:Uncharacterized protein n=1 Tax=Trichoderma semiorbis TaxID=1491008 RepID=A0A9P8HGY8_9HYPO|nr:hypothetical protein TsFJ059_007138 [Trichoderma semiorbis]